MKRMLAVLVLFTTSSWGFASTPVVPDTTLAKEVGNNTSAASAFSSQTNGNLRASNISKVSVRSLLYTGFSGKVYSHLMGWFGGTNHMNVGYESNSATQVASQVSDMMSRGLDGAIIDWYGPSSARVDGATKLLRAEAEKQNGKFQFAVMEDTGALQSCAQTYGCDVTGKMIADLTYAYTTYETSPAYITYNGRPAVFFFGVEAYAIDWARVTASVPGRPLFIQRNSGTFRNPIFAGAYAWPSPNTANPADMGDVYLDDFYTTGLAYSADLAYGTGYKGFNDLLAAWTEHRITNQNCGQTFLDTFAQSAKYYSSTRQLSAIQLATWNDYEEGSELETGIDNCVSVQASSVGKVVSWSLTGSANTVDHYTVFLSTDGVNLMTVSNVPVSQSSYDFSGYALAPGSYTVYVKAVGVPFMLNHMSSATALAIANLPPTAKLAMTTTSGVAPLTVTANSAASTDADGHIAQSAIDFGDGTVISGATAAHVFSKAGTYTVTATVTDNDGASSRATASVVVATPAQAPATPAPGVTVASPLPNSSNSKSVLFVASAKGANPITAMRIYVDSVSRYLTGTASINTTLTLATGTHAVTVQAWDSQGTVYKTSLNISTK